MAELFGFETGVNVPSFSFGLGSTTWFLVMFIIFILILGGIGFFLIHRFKVYNKKIIVFENISGAFESLST